jgi:putative transposase
MWTPATRGRMAEIEKKTKRYPTDLTDEEWARIEPDALDYKRVMIFKFR